MTPYSCKNCGTTPSINGAPFPTNIIIGIECDTIGVYSTFRKRFRSNGILIAIAALCDDSIEVFRRRLRCRLADHGGGMIGTVGGENIMATVFQVGA